MRYLTDSAASETYTRSEAGRFIGNIASQIRVGEMWSSQNNIHSALNNNLTPAVKLTPSDVGLAAPDPLCPNGPQS